MNMAAGKSKEEVVHEFRVHSIQEATMRVIARKGMAAATMQEIAEEAGVAKGTIYLYFRDRDELVEKTFENAITQLHARIDAALDLDAPFEGKLRAMLGAVSGFFRENREFFRLYISMRFPEGNAQQQRRQKRTCQPQYQARVQRVAAILREAMDRGEIRVTDPRRLALFIIEGSNAVIIERVMSETPSTADDDVDFLAGTILGGIRT
ncbi:MAG TPA: TetR/AcrR family transcriptional regulator [Thermoanaerobaculia bacterium]|nr:TetR/AcrR family transcriptional regulator [Thermoanaerobaculia bacterium]